MLCVMKIKRKTVGRIEIVRSCGGTNISPLPIPPSENSPPTIPPGQFPLPSRTIPPVPLKTQLENYIYTCMYAHMHTYIHTCIYTWMYAHTYVCIQYIHACIHT